MAGKRAACLVVEHRTSRQHTDVTCESTEALPFSRTGKAYRIFIL